MVQCRSAARRGSLMNPPPPLPAHMHTSAFLHRGPCLHQNIAVRRLLMSALQPIVGDEGAEDIHSVQIAPGVSESALGTPDPVGEVPSSASTFPRFHTHRCYVLFGLTSSISLTPQQNMNLKFKLSNSRMLILVTRNQVPSFPEGDEPVTLFHVNPLSYFTYHFISQVSELCCAIYYF